MKAVHFIGIKGSGMSSLALICHNLGYKVSGSDIETYIFTQDKLIEKGIDILPFDKNNIKEDVLYILGAAFNAENNIEIAELEKPENKHIERMPYHEFLGKLISEYNSVCIAGSHGKTTTTSMLKAFLEPHGNVGYLIGDGHGHLEKEDEFFAVEACEFLDHFLHYYPNYAIISNIDLDHIDYFKNEENYIKSFQTFVNQVKKGVVLGGDDHNIRKLDTHNLEVLYFGLSENNDVYASDITQKKEQTQFLLHLPGQEPELVTVDIVGKHNILNLLSTIASLIQLGFDKKYILRHINEYKGASRRFVIEDYHPYYFIDDYGHHPTEIKVTLEAARMRFPNSKLVVVYKPDRVSRLDHFFNEFVEALHVADKAYILDFPETAFKEDPTFSRENFYKRMLENEVIYVPSNIEGARTCAQEGEAVYLFTSTKDVYKFKDLIINVLKEDKLI